MQQCIINGMGNAEQPKSNGRGRDNDGRFTKGNPHGFQPGTSGNPSGRPRGSKSGTSALRRMARAFVDPKSGLSAEELIAAKLIAAACDGNLQAIREFYDRIEGRPGVRVEIETEMDWRERALMYGLDENDVIEQAKLLVESNTGSGGPATDHEA